MSLVRLSAALAAIGVHLGAAALLLHGPADGAEVAALQLGNGKDDISIAVPITVQSEQSLGLDAVSERRQDASAGGQAAPEVKEEAQKEPDKIEPAKEESEEPAPLVEEKKPEKTVEAKPSNPAPVSEAQEEQQAASRAFEARRSEVLSLYNGRIYEALMRNALRPKKTERGRVVLELTLAPSGELLAHRVVQSSGSLLLDRTAMTSLERAAPFPPVPPEVTKEPHTLRVPFEYAAK